MQIPDIELTVHDCFTYIKEKDSKGLNVYKVNTTDKDEAFNLYKKNSHRVTFVGCLSYCFNVYVC